MENSRKMPFVQTCTNGIRNWKTNETILSEQFEGAGRLFADGTNEIIR